MREIRIVNAYHHNLKNISLSIPKGKITVICGVSGSGKSTLAYDIIHAEGQRRYIEALSNYARQFLNKFEKPKVEYIEGISPTICVDQRIKNINPRSTVGTATEIYDYLRLIFANIGVSFCPNCNIPISKLEPHQIVDNIMKNFENNKITILCPLVKQKKGDHSLLIEKVRRLGFVKIVIDGVKVDVDSDIFLNKNEKHDIDIVIDSLVVNELNRQRLMNSVLLSFDTSLKIGRYNQKIVKIENEGRVYYYSGSFACHECGFSYPEISWRLFSFNTPLGACEHCKGIGSVIDFNVENVIDFDLSIEDGAIKFLGRPNFSYSWHKVTNWWIKIRDFCKKVGISFNVPLNAYHKDLIDNLINGDEDFEGLKLFLSDLYYNYDFDFEDLVFEKVCPECKGYRLNRTALSVKVNFAGNFLNIGELCSKSVEEIYSIMDMIILDENHKIVVENLISEVKKRLKFLLDIGLWYLDLYRKVGSLSTGEAQRVKIASLLASSLSGVTYILDEPTIGLHPYNISKIIDGIRKLKELGNTVIVVEHDGKVIENADYIVELGYEGGRNGGYLVNCDFIENVKNSPTLDYVRKYKETVKISKDYIVKGDNSKFLKFGGINLNNLKNISVELPLNRLVVITGVSGSGKSSLLVSLYRILKGDFRYGNFEGEFKGNVLMVDSKPIGKTPRSCLATYTKVWDEIRKIFASLPEAKRLGFAISKFSFNRPEGRCDKCKGEGFIKIDMNFLPDVYVKCEACEGRRYSYEVLNVKFDGYSIADILDLTVDECIEVFRGFPMVVDKLRFISEIGLGYMKLGQISPTYSGGEVQRLKLAQELSKRSIRDNIYFLDEPTTGLHFEDVEKLLNVFYRILVKGATIVVVEHNMDIIKNADWIIDVGPEASFRGGEIVFSGTLENFINSDLVSYTKDYLVKFLELKKDFLGKL
ncbi:MAG: excinuclease ABC subunit UvrA [bacterium]